MLVKTKIILEKANKGNYAVGAFNINDLEFLQAVVKASQSLSSPVIIQVSEGAIKYAGLDYLLVMVKTAAKNFSLSLHLDHGRDLGLIKRCVDLGFSSVMFDGSNLDYKKNIALTQKVVNWAHKRRISVEAELGAIKGKEDNIYGKESFFTDPKKAQEFVKLTKCDFLAVSVGTVHGAFKGKPKLDFKRLKEIKALVKIPLVLHGASSVPLSLVKIARKYGAQLKGARGIADSDLKKAIKLGIKKVNCDTDLRLAFTDSLRQTLKERPEVFDPREILGPAKELMEKIVKQRIKILGSENKA